MPGPTVSAPRGCPMSGRIDGVSVAILEERLRAMHDATHESLARIEGHLAAQNGRLRAVEEAQAEAKGAGRVKERIGNLVSAIVGGLVVAFGKQFLSW